MEVRRHDSAARPGSAAGHHEIEEDAPWTLPA
jgi:hypothetical protein